MDIVPDGPAQHGGVHTTVHGYGVVGQVINHLELLIQELPHVRVQAVDQRVAVVLPGVILMEKVYRGRGLLGKSGVSLSWFQAG